MSKLIQPGETLRVMVFGAHPDDCDVSMGGTALRFVQAGARVQFVSLTNGNKGHQSILPVALAKRRLDEAEASAAIFGVEKYTILSHEDCELTADLATRRQVTTLIRAFAPHLVFCPRLCDYHPDHRATAQLIQDASYIVNVPHWCQNAPIRGVTPVIYFVRDSFRYPRELRPDVLVPIDEQLNLLLTALCCHESQFFEWLPYDKGIREVPDAEHPEERKAFIRRYWIDARKQYDRNRFFGCLQERFGEAAAAIGHVDAFELSEYGNQPTEEDMEFLFPFPVYRRETWKQTGHRS